MVAARVWRGLSVLAVVSLLAACAGKPDVEAPGLPTQGVYKIGKPYQVKGIWYYPKEDFGYDETGIASWYGPGFHAKQTANGEIYDQNEMTAAHKTLPMPSLVRVTNLDNGRSVVVRINDRGPFVAGRVIDMTRRGAQLLGFETAGTAKVRVQILADESRAIAAAARRNTPAPMLAEEEGAAPTPAAAPRAKIEVAETTGSGSRPSSAPEARPASTAAPIESPRTVDGSEVGGRFVPSPVVATLPVGGSKQIYVQAGAFTVSANAERVRQRLAGVGSAKVSLATVDGRRFYRVRIGPIGDVPAADSVLNRVVEAGITDARIIVD